MSRRLRPLSDPLRTVEPRHCMLSLWCEADTRKHGSMAARTAAARGQMLTVQFTVLATPAQASILADHLIETTTRRDELAAQRAFDAMMKMKKIEIAAIEAARCGASCL